MAVMNLWVQPQVQPCGVLPRPWFEQGEDVLEQAPQGKVHRFRHIRRFLQPGEVEDLVEDRQQSLPRCRQCPQALAVTLAERCLAQQLGHAQDAVQRGTDLMAHGREKTALGAVGGFRLVLRPAQAGGAPLDLPTQLVAVGVAPAAIGAQGLAHVLQGGGDGVDLVAFAVRLVQSQRLLQVAFGDMPSELGHAPQMASDQAVEQPTEGHRQAAKETAHPQEAGQAAGGQPAIDRRQVDGDLQLAQMPTLAPRRLVAQGKALDPQQAAWTLVALQQVEVGALQTDTGDVGEIPEAAQLHVQLLLVEIPQAALEAGQVAAADQFQARLDLTHFAAVFEEQLHGAGEDSETQAEQQHPPQQAPRQHSAAAAHQASARLPARRR